jgi:RNA recognition motif-containing protein
MSTGMPIGNNYASWERFVADCDDGSSKSPLTSQCSSELLMNTDWVDTLIDDNEAPTKAPSPGWFDHFEDRSVYISNFDAGETVNDDVLAMCSPCGDIESIDTSQKSIGRIIVTFFDIRSAYAMIRSTICVRGSRWYTQFGHHECGQKRSHNNRTIAVFRVPTNVTREIINAKFTEFGEIREIRQWRAHAFIEFWDARSATKAVKEMHGKKLFGASAVVEMSRSGRVRVNQQVYDGQKRPSVVRVSRAGKKTINFEKGGRKCQSAQQSQIQNAAKTPLILTMEGDRQMICV